MFDELLRQAVISFNDDLDVPVQELVIWNNAIEQGCTFELTRVEEGRGCMIVHARTTWPTGRCIDDIGAVFIQGLSAEEFGKVRVKTARMALCRTICSIYPFEEEDLLPPGTELLELDLDTGELHPKPKPNPIKKMTVRHLKDDKFPNS